MAYYGNTVRALIKVGATTVELLTQQRGSAEHTRHPLTWPWRVFLPSHPLQWHPGNWESLGHPPGTAELWNLQCAHASHNTMELLLAGTLKRDL